MLKPEYFNDKADRMIEIYRQLEDYILQDIANRLLESQSVSGTADRMLWKLQQMGESRAEIMKKLSQITKLSRRELQELLQDAVITSWKDDLSVFNMMGVEVSNPLENPAVISVMDAEYKKSQGELRNLTRTTMNQANSDLIRMLDEAEMRIASGMQSYSAAVCKILDEYAGKGVMIEYPKGTKRTLEAAVRMCVVTSMNQTSAQITNQYIIEAESEYVLVSAHPGARIQPPGQPYLAGHENWQGKVYKIRGSEPGYPNLLEKTGYDISEDGEGKVVNLLGLHGYNCRHSHGPWDKSLRNPYFDDDGKFIIDREESRKLYKNQQKQRAMERAIRKTKRQLLMKQAEIDSVAETDVKQVLQEEYDKLAYTLRQQNKACSQFCEDNGLQKQADRMKVAGFKRKQTAKANGRATAYENLKKKSAHQETKNIIKEKSMKSSVSVDSNTIKQTGRTIRTPENLQEAAQRIHKELGTYVKNKSLWSGKIIIDNARCELTGCDAVKEWTCDILLRNDVDDGHILHEMLHSASISYYGEKEYVMYGKAEEAAVEFFTQEICKAQGRIHEPAYGNYVTVLRALNGKMRFFSNDFEFAKEFYHLDLSARYTWLHDKVSEYIIHNKVSIKDAGEIIDFISVLEDVVL